MQERIQAWMTYLNSVEHWKELVRDITPRFGGCGWIYELGNPLKRPEEDLAIADMSQLKFTDPHYHLETEWYIGLQGTGKVFVSGVEYSLSKGVVVVIPSNRAHFTLPEKDLVLAVVNNPPFKLDHCVPLTQDVPEVGFDKHQFDLLCANRLVPEAI